MRALATVINVMPNLGFEASKFTFRSQVWAHLFLDSYLIHIQVSNTKDVHVYQITEKHKLSQIQDQEMALLDNM